MKSSSICVAVGVLAAMVSSPADATVVSGPISNGGHDYYLVSQNTWISAELEAQTLGGHLATVNDAAENSFLVSAFVLDGHTNDPLWMGLNDAAAEGTFVWASGEPVTFINWYSGEPNNDFGLEDYGTINWPFSANVTPDHGLWNDAPLNGTTGYAGHTDGPYFGIVEVVPEPSTLVIAGLGFACLMIGGWRQKR